MKGKPFILEPWLEAIVGHLYGWKSETTNLRRYRELLVLVPRKNVKSLLGAGLAIVELFIGADKSILSLDQDAYPMVPKV